jgi:hypothetical protein
MARIYQGETVSDSNPAVLTLTVPVSIAIDGAATVNGLWAISSTRPTLYILLDPDETIIETDETNNLAYVLRDVTARTAKLSITGPGDYVFGNTCARLHFDQIGTLKTITVTLIPDFPTVQTVNRPLPRRYEITGDGTGFTATLTLCYAEPDLTAAGVITESALQLNSGFSDDTGLCYNRRRRPHHQAAAGNARWGDGGGDCCTGKHGVGAGGTPHSLCGYPGSHSGRGTSAAH